MGFRDMIAGEKLNSQLMWIPQFNMNLFAMMKACVWHLQIVLD